ncbi:ATP-dependent DNA ligase [uncultured Amnibacterium sp.]|uniref:DUF7882 family protein n=1 Tax=uncultured Amnibacterium sp. TaxID=1631851 RepID=UPI0035CA2E68
MGTLSYGHAIVEFDDRTLSHLQIVIMQKFRRGESFPMSWIDSIAIGDGRSAWWLTPSNPVFFKFDGSRVPAVDQAWVDRLTRSAESPRGLVVTDVDGGLIAATGANHRPVAAHHAVR